MQPYFSGYQVFWAAIYLMKINTFRDTPEGFGDIVEALLDLLEFKKHFLSLKGIKSQLYHKFTDNEIQLLTFT